MNEKVVEAGKQDKVKWPEQRFGQSLAKAYHPSNAT
jgi:hypothetical protein